jgi:hypothetical protein
MVKVATSRRLPDVLPVVIVFGNDLKAFSHEVGRKESDTELANHGDIRTSVKPYNDTSVCEM